MEMKMEDRDVARNAVLSRFAITPATPSNYSQMDESNNQNQSGPNDIKKAVQPRDLSSALEEVLEKKNEDLVVDDKVLLVERKKQLGKTDNNLLNDMLKSFL
jgi:hypothetical protein